MRKTDSRMTAEDNPHPPPLNAGLCTNCLHARRIESARRSFFVLCQLSATDPRFRKYPSLPVFSCTGYSPVPPEPKQA